MEYAHAAHTYFPAATQPYPFVGVPQPLTPSNSNSTGSEDYTTSPPEVYGSEFPVGEFPIGEQFHNFDQYAAAAQFNPHQPFPAPPAPPTPPSQQRPGLSQQPPPHAPHAPAPHLPAGSDDAGLPVMMGMGMAEAQDDGSRNGKAGSNSEEDEMNPAKLVRRKEQNRAAQRAFRERKERHVRDLEAKLALLQAAQKHAETENERLKRDLQKMSTENEILKATSSLQLQQQHQLQQQQQASGSSSISSGPPTETGPMSYNPVDFYSDILNGHPNKGPMHRIVESESGERLYSAGATWDFLVGHEAFRKGLVDISDISNRLRPLAKCDGQGPVFEENAILKAIEESAANGSDELL